jgi:hypothetical protein
MAGAVSIPLKTIFDDAGVKKAMRSISGLGKSLKGALAGVGIGLGIGAISAQLAAAAKAAVADTKAQALLANQLRNTTGATTSQIAGTEAFIQKLQLQTSILDDQLRPAMASLVRATGDVSHAQGLLAVATDVSAATGKDFESVALALGKAVSGQTTALFRMIPGLKGSSDWMAKLKDLTKGAAEAAANNDPFARMNIILNDLQETIGQALLPMLNDFANWLASEKGQKAITDFANAIKDVIKVIVDLIRWISDNIQWLSVLATQIGLATVAVVGFNAVLNTNPIMLMVTAIGLLVAAFAALQNVGTTAANGIPKAVNNAANAAGKKAYEEALRAKENFEMTPTGPVLKPGAQMKAEQARNAAAQKVIDQFKADQARIAAEKVPGITAPLVPSLPDLPAPKGTKSNTAANKQLADAVQKAKDAFDAQVKAYRAAVDAAQDVIDSTKEMMAGFTELFAITPKMGEFESKVVDGFKSIFETINNAFDKGQILEGAKKSLTSFANSTLATLKSYAQQQDALAQKIDIARTITSGVTGLANLTSMLETTTESVTSTTRTMANGIETIMTKTFDVTKTGGIVDNFKALVDKTKAFATNLISLKKLGLNKNLFAQLVNAGADAGGATAQAIVDGGSETIVALNDLYKELDLSAASIAETSTQTLYEVGQQIVSNGFIEGLVSQADALAAAAKSLADTFAASFQAQLGAALQAALPAAPVPPAITASMERPDPKQSPQRYAAWLAGIGGIDPIRSPERYKAQQAALNAGTTYNVTVNAGLGTNGTTAAQEFINTVKAYERANGQVWMSA